MKLELKHYLNTDLKMKSPQGFRPNVKESTGILGIVYLTADLYADIENNTFNENKFIPILRPLSYITKEIEVNGEKFVPSKWFKENYYSDIYDFRWFKNKTNLINIDHLLPYHIINKLFEWHFDVFGQIPLRSSIYINSFH